jgi:hypothetical protein
MLKEIATEMKLPILKKSSLNQDMSLLQGKEQTIHLKQKKDVSHINYGAILEKHRDALDEIQHLEVFAQHPGAHPLPGKSLSSHPEDIQQAKTHYESRLKETQQNLQQALGSSISVDSLLEQKKLLDEIQHLEVFGQHPGAHPLPGKSLSSNSEDIQQARIYYENRIRELKKKLQ